MVEAELGRRKEIIPQLVRKPLEQAFIENAAFSQTMETGTVSIVILIGEQLGDSLDQVINRFCREPQCPQNLPQQGVFFFRLHARHPFPSVGGRGTITITASWQQKKWCLVCVFCYKVDLGYE